MQLPGRTSLLQSIENVIPCINPSSKDWEIVQRLDFSRDFKVPGVGESEFFVNEPGVEFFIFHISYYHYLLDILAFFPWGFDKVVEIPMNTKLFKSLKVGISSNNDRVSDDPCG